MMFIAHHARDTMHACTWTRHMQDCWCVSYACMHSIMNLELKLYHACKDLYSYRRLVANGHQHPGLQQLSNPGHQQLSNPGQQQPTGEEHTEYMFT